MLLLAAALAASGAWLAARAAGNEPQPARIEYFANIKPLLAVHCYRCQDAEMQKGGLRLDVAADALAGGESGEPAIVPGASGRSALLRRVTSHDRDEQMPPKGARLSEAEVARLRQWIDGGAHWPERDDYWAFQPPTWPAVPEIAPPERAAHPIDRFLLARLEAAGITPVAHADRRTLLRRAYFDLLGLPPSPEEAAPFFADQSPNAFARLIDRLLADRRYGERWARHWLDLVRYAESDGYEDDKVRPHAWRYRDYVVRSLYADKPYDRFVQEQIAGDELWPADADAWIANGFARLGAWDGMSKDPEKQRQDFLNDATDAVGAVFLGVTLGCARFHDQRYDAISQRDYFRVQAFFAGVKREVRGLPGKVAEPASVTAAYRAEHARLETARSEREELLRVAKTELEQERGDAEWEKIEDGAVRKRAEKLRPGRLDEWDGRITKLAPQVRLLEPKAEAVFAEAGRAPKTRLLKGGELARPGAEVVPGFLEAMLPAGSADAPLADAKSAKGRRPVLARWLTHSEHPLTARVLVNRLWQQHFGVGLVPTPSDFGRNGRAPSHPELLDWLARRFGEDGFSLKQMHRLMMTSAAYQRVSSADAYAAARDPENRLLWRMARRRLEAEAIRDSILAVSGALHPAMGGPGIYARLPQGVNVEFPNNDKELSWGSVTDDDDRRRSVYLSSAAR